MTVDLDALEVRAATTRGNSREIIEMLMAEVRELRTKLEARSNGGLAADLVRRSGRPDLVRQLERSD